MIPIRDRRSGVSLAAALVGQRILSVELADPSALGLRLEGGEVVLLATLHRDRADGHEARLSVEWDPNEGKPPDILATI